jgi:hypothetical protein
MALPPPPTSRQLHGTSNLTCKHEIFLKDIFLSGYRTSKSSSALVGYAAIDGDTTWRDPLASYLSCDPSGGNSGSTAIDLYGLNN